MIILSHFRTYIEIMVDALESYFVSSGLAEPQ